MTENRFDPVIHLFPYVIKPGRYAGNEPGVVIPQPDAAVRLLLVHPGEPGAHLADLDYQRLYHILNLVPGVAAERAILFDEDARQRLDQLRVPPFSLETKSPWTAFHFLIFYISDPLDALRIPRMLVEFRAAGAGPPVVFISAGAVFPPFLGCCSAIFIGGLSFTDLVRTLGEKLGFDSGHAVEQFFSRGETTQLVALTGTQTDELKIPLFSGPLNTARETTPRQPGSVARDLLLGLDKTGLENVRFISPRGRHYPKFPDIFTHLSQRANLAHLQIRVPPITPDDFLANWTGIRPHFLKSELPLVFPGGKHIDDIESHPLAEAGRQALALGWQVIVLAYCFNDWNEYRGGLSSLVAMADHLVRQCKSYADKRVVRINWVPAAGIDWQGPLEYDGRIQAVLNAIHQGAAQRLPGVPMENYFEPCAELLRQFLLRAGPELTRVLAELPFGATDGRPLPAAELFAAILAGAHSAGVALPEFGRPLDLSLSPFLEPKHNADLPSDRFPEPTDLPVLAEVFGRRQRKAAFTRRLGTVPQRRLRVQYAKTEQLRFFSHLDVARMVERAVRRSRIPVEYSAGYHPRPKISFGPPLPWGAISRAEYFDVVLDADFEPGHVNSLKANFPVGLEIIATLPLPAKAVSLFERINVMSYRVKLPHSARAWEGRIKEFMAQSSVWFERVADSGTKRVDLRPHVRELRLNTAGVDLFIEMEIAITAQGGVRPADIITYLGGAEDLDPRELVLERLQVFIQEGARRTEPMAFI